MARKRFITSEISTDRKIAALAEESQTAALMWPWITTALDDWGRMGADPMEVKLTVFPAFPFTSKEIAEAIQLLDKYGLVHYYEVDNKPYLAVNPATWYKYQTYIKTERKEKQLSKCPEPVDAPWVNKEEQQQTTAVADNQQKSATIVLSPSPSLSPSKNNKADDHNARTRAITPVNNYVKIFEAEFGRPISPNENECLKSYVSEGMEQEVICEAIKRTRMQGKTNLKYTLSILNNWLIEQVTTLAGVGRADLEFELRKNRKAKGGQASGRDRPDYPKNPGQKEPWRFPRRYPEVSIS